MEGGYRDARAAKSLNIQVDNQISSLLWIKDVPSRTIYQTRKGHIFKYWFYRNILAFEKVNQQPF